MNEQITLTVRQAMAAERAIIGRIEELEEHIAAATNGPLPTPPRLSNLLSWAGDALAEYRAVRAEIRRQLYGEVTR